MSEPFIAQIVMFGGNFAPRGWAFCNGQILSIAQNTALFSLVGTTYGGDGRTTFGLPDLRGRFPTHSGGSTGPGLPSRPWGSRGGSYSQTLTANQLPAHSHVVQWSCNSESANTDDPSGAVPAVGNAEIYSNTTNDEMAPFNTTSTGGSQAVDITNPYLTINFIIALFGVYPPRD